MELNRWSLAEVNKAESTWGQKTPQFVSDMFDFAIDEATSWLDLGCGFGRFLKYLTSKVEDPDYIGYDSSPEMIERIKENFPVYYPRLFVHNILKPISNYQSSVVCSAVFIHLPAQDQDKILNNVRAISPHFFTFDINSPSEEMIGKNPYFERRLKSSEHVFRMTWQSHYIMTRKILSIFDGYSLTVKFYKIQGNKNKVVYFLRK